MGLSVNNFGWLPSNPDTLLDQVSIGGGTNRPIGFSFSQLFNLYWTVKSFNVSASVISYSSSNGNFGSSIGELLNTMAAMNSQNNLNVGISGNTKVTQNFKQEIRSGTRTKDGEINKEPIDFYTWNGIQENEIITSVRRKTAKELGESAAKGYTPVLNVNNKSEVNEGTLLSAGPVHRYSGSGGGLTIDFSSITYRKSLYWPIITLSFNGASSLVTVGSAECSGGIFCLGGVIPIFVNPYVLGNPLLVFAQGNISINKQKDGRFYHDGISDKERLAV